MQQLTTISGNIVDILHSRIYQGTLTIEDGKIISIETNNDQRKTNADTQFILPGFVDAHIHIESSMLVPSEFARLATPHGTVATVSDPHEIGNVLGVAGVDYMIMNGKTVPFKFNFGAPSCVPATRFETAGATIDSILVDELLRRNEIKYLSEMMNYPGVIHKDAECLAKIAAAHKYNKPVDGHAPGVRGEDIRSYIAAGISTDHECFTLEEALEKLSLGMKILIREGSAAKNFEALHPILSEHWKMAMFCSDDKHPNDLRDGHINELVKRAIGLGYDPMHVLYCACVHPVQHYNLDVGLLQEGDAADFIVVDNLSELTVHQTIINGMVVASDGKSQFDPPPAQLINNFQTTLKTPAEFEYRVNESHYNHPKLRVIEALDGQLITNELDLDPKVVDDCIDSDIERDILKITVVNRYGVSPPAIGFIRNFGLKEGAIASCVGHDSHNIIAVGVTDEAICRAVNLITEAKGGIAVVSDSEEDILPLPVAGIMTNVDGYETARAYERLDAKAKKLGCTLHAPFMTLSFMALPVIPQLKLTDKGLFDVSQFAMVDMLVCEV